VWVGVGVGVCVCACVLAYITVHACMRACVNACPVVVSCALHTASPQALFVIVMCIVYSIG
jgi:hypothetical protein